MGIVATYQEVYDLLESTPAASLSWVEALVAARMSLTAVAAFIETMSRDADSPLRASENEVLGEEIRKLNIARGSESVNRSSMTKYSLRVRAVLSPAEQQRVVRIVGGFCQPIFETSKRFGKNGHAVMNAVRRVLTGYMNSRIPNGASIVEVGPDVTSWILSPSPGVWAGERVHAYSAARPNITPRDSVRMTWARLTAEIVIGRSALYDADQVKKAKIFSEMRQRVFSDARVPTSSVAGEYMTSYDSNYDIAFSDMPVAMAMSGARAWYGTMVRAKGLTSVTRLKQGALSLMGVNYRVDWDAGRIDFRHPECNAFGYSHNVHEYIKYEERHGYTWFTNDCDYVYTKGPETTDEILFFSVVRVPKLYRLYEPRFTENPHSGMLKLHSLWGQGDELGGIPRKFAAVDFFVDALNFWKVLEKRRALDHKGDISVSLSLVRSTNVKFYMHGTPIGANEKIAARLAPATAIVVETMVHEQRLRDNCTFDVAMYQFDLSVASTSWLSRLLASVIDFKVATGKVVGPIVRSWHELRSSVIDNAIAPLSKVRVGCESVQPHVILDRFDPEYQHSLGFASPATSECLCAEIADLRAAMDCASKEQYQVFSDYLFERERQNTCTLCDPIDIFQQPESSSEQTDDVSSNMSVADTDDTEFSEVVENESCQVVEQALDEFIRLESYLLDNNSRECRIDYDIISRSGLFNEFTVLSCSTGRTKHAILKFSGGRCVSVIGEHSIYSAMYNPIQDKVVPIRVRGDTMRADVADGFYYTCNRMEVWNAPSLIAAVEYAKSYGSPRTPRSAYQVTLGVPGAGKTYALMAEIARRWKRERDFKFHVLAVTNESVKAAKKYGQQFGVDKDMLESRVMTLDKYLMHKKTPTDYLCIDEFPMVHMGKIDAAVAISSASTVSLFGDARQIPYDPFCSEFKMHRATLGDSVPESRVNFLPMTHRLSRDTCAMWIDKYPSIYPCDCCNISSKNVKTLTYESAKDILHVKYDDTVRYHTYLRDDRDDLRIQLGMRKTKEQLRAQSVGGLATVHEDQGSTHDHVVSVRLTTDYDKNASKRNPSLFNRENYVLTDTTRHVKSFHYISLSDEYDLVKKRIDMSTDQSRLQAVDNKENLFQVTISSML